MKRINDAGLKLAQWIESIDWHWVPLVAQAGMVLALLLPLRGGMIPDFANEYGLPVVLVRLFWLILFGLGVIVLYVWRGSVGFILGSAPLLLYVVVGYFGYSIYLNNYLPFFVGFALFGLTLKTFLRMQNGKIRHD